MDKVLLDARNEAFISKSEMGKATDAFVDRPAVNEPRRVKPYKPNRKQRRAQAARARSKA